MVQATMMAAKQYPAGGDSETLQYGALSREIKETNIDECDTDSLHILPLGIIPFETSAIKRARLIKNAQLESVIEAFNEKGVGQAQVDVKHAAGFFGWENGTGMKDRAILQSLSKLHSYDVFALRIELRRLEIPPEEAENLRLSNAMQEDLARYMKVFTYPLLETVFGSKNKNFSNMGDLISIFRRPNQEETIYNLNKMARQLSVKVHEILDFLEEYADVYLALSYYKKCFEDTMPKIDRFYDAMEALQSFQQCANDRNLMKICEEIKDELQNLTVSLTGRFDSFERRSNNLWENADARSFDTFRKAITSHHTTLGAVLCGLSVKMTLWEKQFGDDRGGPVKQGDFIRSHMRDGLDSLAKIDKSAPSLSSL
jgi:hypothetical protein